MNYINVDAVSTPVHPTLFTTENVLSQSALDLIQEYCGHGHVWHMDRPMARLSLPPGNDEDPFEHIGHDMAAWVSDVFRSEVRYRKAKLFLDLPGSEVPLHKDADNIDIMSQVYLTHSDHPIPGTTFMEPYPFTVPFQYNSGYLNDNRDRKTHRSGFVINGYRLSIGFQFYFPR
jgi:hypothetical protein